MWSSDTEPLCGIIKTRAADFNHVVDVATPLGKALEAPRHRVPREIMDILGLCFEEHEPFDPQGIASSLHILAKEKYGPQERLSSAVEQRAELRAGEFQVNETSSRSTR